ncbi:alpha/beta hydrolase fold domain-containing protein [Sphingomonas colocasiae]|uniref:Alpha/beta hydrolase fold domain-containing protein n=1 Tax=Sphingomonas colocasiae TaxID=1848973 RepID=A0ABS7PJR3_9SPHN|nr:alpha/beta hydrolase fold domain-containing protein [Sphingomonas colocasiae]MBY8821528.1 alpha/beta hydrolase fold domain-containing protein [Sphingomonas colocasiae]
MKALIAGGGVAGLTAALALLREGIDVQLFERAPEMSEIGAGIQMSPNGTRILDHLGLLDAFRERAVATERLDFHDLETGSPVYTVPLGAGAAERYGQTFYQCHRADLLQVMVDRLPPNIVSLGADIVGVGQDGDRAWLKTADGVRHWGDVVLACDGIHSVVRDRVFNAVPLRDSGLSAWRALIPWEIARDFGIGHISAAWFGKARAAVAYWVRPGELFNLVGIVTATEVNAESWTRRGAVTALRKSFDGCNPVLRRIVDSVDDAFLTGFMHRSALESYVSGRIALVGDAAHAMLPFLAQGGVQAMEDAVTLARLLAKHGAGDVAGAMAAYDALRRPRANLVQSTATAMASLWTIGDEQQIRMRNGRFRGIMRIDPYAETIWGWLYGHDAVAAADARIVDAPPPPALDRDVARHAFEICSTFITPEDHERGIPGLRDAYNRLLARFPATPGTQVTPVSCNGVSCLIVSDPSASEELRVMHFHGGGYVVGSAEGAVEYAGRLSRASGHSVLVVDYRLAPEHPFPAAVEDAGAAYAWLCEQHEAPILISGESAGGGLAVILGLRVRDEGVQRAPAGYYLLSPYTDLEITGASVDEAKGRDPLANRDLLVALSGAYLQGHDPCDPMASPIHADLTGLAPMLIGCSAVEALRGDSERLFAVAQANGVPSRLLVYPDTLHIFALFPFLPEADEWLGELPAFANAAHGGLCEA